MPLPPKAIEQLGREPVRTPGWSGRILMFTGTLFFLSLAIYFGILVGYRPLLDGRLRDAEKAISDFKIQTPIEEQNKIIVLFSQLKNLEDLLLKQKFSSLVFPWFEETTDPDIYFSKFSLDVTRNPVNVSGQAKSLNDIVDELAILGGREEVSKIGFSGASRDRDGLWSFGLNITFNNNFFIPSDDITTQ